MKNPFTPAFGIIPYELAGRTDILAELAYAYDNAPGDPNLTCILTGARGTGKTTLLTYVAEQIKGNGWISVNVSCVKGMMEDILQQTVKNAEEIVDIDKKKELTGFSGSILGIELGLEYKVPETVLNWRSRYTPILEALNDKNIGVLITIDEVNPRLDDLKEFISYYQLFVRDRMKIAVLMAGLPQNVSMFLSNDPVSFLRRATQKSLESISEGDIEHAFSKTIRDGGKDIDEDALRLAVKAINGFPYMLQLIGYKAWKEAGSSKIIRIHDIEIAIKLAENDVKRSILKESVDSASQKGIDFLLAMLEDENESYTAEIARRMGKTTSYVATYKKRLLELGLIENAGKGKVRYSLPMMREYLTELNT